MKRNIIISKIEQQLFSFWYENESLCKIETLMPNDETCSLGAIYTAQVKNIVPNISAAFLNIGSQTVFYSLDENKQSIFLNTKKDANIKPGDEILVQIDKEPVKSKQASASCYLNLTGENLALTLYKTGIGVSKKINGTLRNQLKKLGTTWLNQTDHNVGIIFRTNSIHASKEQLRAEFDQLYNQLADILNKATYLPAGKLVYKNKDEYKDMLNWISSDENGSIITDQEEIYNTLITQSSITKQTSIHQWNKEISIHAVYELKAALANALNKQIWLSSGGFLVLEPTEAMVVIDVNTGKSIAGKHHKQQHILETNLEAAKEIARQIMIRNYSGIIIIDFIDMKAQDAKEQLLSYLAEQLKLDSVKTTLVDITKLGLVEITRQKIKKPLHEQLKLLK